MRKFDTKWYIKALVTALLGVNSNNKKKFRFIQSSQNHVGKSDENRLFRKRLRVKKSKLVSNVL